MRVFPIKTLLPKKDDAQRIASLGSGKLSAEVLQSKAQALPESYLRVVKPQFLDSSLMSETQAFYDASRANLSKLLKEKFLLVHEPNVFLYEQTHHSGKKIAGWIVGVDAEDYLDGRIKKHENTLTSKENRLVRHISALESMAEPVLLSQQLPLELNQLVLAITSKREADLSVSDEFYNTHKVWKVEIKEEIDLVCKLLNNLPSLYIADGHHRCASSSRYLTERFGNNSGKGIMALIADESELLIKPFFRMLKGVDSTILWDFLEEHRIHHYEIGHSLGFEDLKKGQVLCIAKDRRCVIELSESMLGDKAIDKLDVRVVEKKILQPAFGLSSSSEDDRYQFLRGDTPLDSIKLQLQNGDIDLAFLFAPNQMEEVRAVADEGDTMPAKSTFIEPKIPTGLIIEDYR